MSEPLLRRACDRCHAQKLSCRREDLNSDCIRCVKANKPCDTSPSLRNKNNRPPAESSTGPSKELSGLQQTPRKRPRTSVETIQSTTTTAEPEDSREAFLSITAGWDSTDLEDDLGWPNHHPFWAFGKPGELSSEGHDRPSAKPTVDWDTSIVPFSGAEYTKGSSSSSSSGQAYAADFDPNDLMVLANGTTGCALVPDAQFQSNVKGPEKPVEDSRASQFSALLTDPLSSQGSTTSLLDSRWLVRLMNMNVTLFQQGEKVGQLCAKTLSSTASHDKDASDMNKAQSSVHDETILLFFDFVRLLRQSRSSVGDLESLSSQPKTASQPARESAAGGSLTRSALDPGSVLITLSCYIRILDICKTLLGVIQAWVASSDASQARLQLPTLAISSRSLEDFPTLQLKLVLETYENLLTSMRTLLMPLVAEGDERERRSVDERPKMAWGKQSTSGMHEIAGQTIHSLEDVAFKMIEQIRLALAKTCYESTSI